MPRYFFDVVIDGERHLDLEGCVLADLDAAKAVAKGMLRVEAHERPNAMVLVQVRDGSGRYVHTEIEMT